MCIVGMFIVLAAGLHSPGVTNGLYCVLLVPLAVLAELLQGTSQSDNGQ